MNSGTRKVRDTFRTIRKPRPIVVTILILTGMTLVSSLAYVQGIPVDAQLAATIVTPSVTGSVNILKPGQEAFWSGITGLPVPLTSSATYGGSTKTVTIKMANNGTYLLILATWSDPTQSRTNRPIIENETYGGLFYANTTYYYEDRIVFWWNLDQSVGPAPCMTEAAFGHGEGQALNQETGNLWHWKGARTDLNGTLFGQLKYGSGPNKGQTITPTNSYADNEFINSTGHYQLGWDQYPTAASPGNFTIGSDDNGVPYNTFMVAAHGVYDSSSHTWTWVAARPLTVTPTLHDVQFTGGNTYYFAVGIWDGGPIPIPAGTAAPAGWQYYGENEETKSISSWFTMQTAAPTDFTLYYVVGGVAAAAVVAGLAVFMIRKRKPAMKMPSGQVTSQH